MTRDAHPMEDLIVLPELVVEMTVKRVKPPTSDTTQRFPDYETLAQFTLPAQADRAFVVYRDAMSRLVEGTVAVTVVESPPPSNPNATIAYG